MSQEIILEIKEINNKEGGYSIRTTQQTIFILIDNEAHCCETWGWMVLPQEDLEYFLNAELLNISIVDEYHNKSSLDLFEGFLGLEETYALFVDIETSKGVMTITLYNSHNGYYGHDVKIISQQLNYKGVL